MVPINSGHMTSHQKYGMYKTSLYLALFLIYYACLAYIQELLEFLMINFYVCVCLISTVRVHFTNEDHI